MEEPGNATGIERKSVRSRRSLTCLWPSSPALFSRQKPTTTTKKRVRRETRTTKWKKTKQNRTKQNKNKKQKKQSNIVIVTYSSTSQPECVICSLFFFFFYFDLARQLRSLPSFVAHNSLQRAHYDEALPCNSGLCEQKRAIKME